MIESLLIIGSLYTGALFFLSYRSRKEIKTSSDFMLGGAKIGLVLGFMTFAATLFSTFTLMGMPDFSRNNGVGAWVFLAFSCLFRFFELSLIFLAFPRCPCQIEHFIKRSARRVANFIR